MRLTLVLAALSGLALAGCTAPHPADYVRGGGPVAGAIDVGRNASGEACTQQDSGGSAGVDIFCGSWEQPSAHVRRGEPADPAGLAALATASAWRSGLDTRLDCAAPVATTLLGTAPAMLLQCKRRIGGWPQVAVVASIDGTAWYADGVLPSLPVIERAIGVGSGRLAAGAPAPSSGADALLASRLAAQAFSSGDIGQFDGLMLAGGRANLSQSFPAAEQAFRAALALQQKALGRDSPDTVAALVPLAVQISDEGRFADADTLFVQADRLTPAAADRTAPARLVHYRALHEVNQGHYAAALVLIDKATMAYAALLPSDVTHTPPPARPAMFGAGATSELPRGETLVIDPSQRVALIGVIETLRYRAIILRALNRPAESEAAIRSAADIAANSGLRQPILTARLYRTAATTDGLNGQTDAALSGLSRSSADFDVALPGTRPVAETALLRAANLQRQGRPDEALAQCRAGTALLRSLKVGTAPDLLDPCLGVYEAAADRGGVDRQKLLGEMFEAAQLNQGGITSQQIAQATARLGETARDPKVGAAIRRRQDAGTALSALYQRREALLQDRPPEQLEGPAISSAELDRQIAAAQAVVSDSDAALQAASPNYGQLVQQVVPAADVLAALAADEAFVAVTLSGDHGWIFLLRGGEITARPVGASPAEVTALVKRLRAGIELGDDDKLPRFDTDAAQRLYAATLGPVEAGLAGAKSLVVAPTGPLLAIPFGVLLTGPGDADHLGDAPWLIRRVAVSHVPSAANFVSLRRIAGTSRATQPWFGFGDFHPVPLALARRSFPAACADSARLFAGLPTLPFARRELEAARGLLGGSAADERVGAGFTADAVRKIDLKDMRVLHFAAHALLPEELRCESEPAIVTSVPAGANDASGALLTSSEVMGLDLDAELVILSACNSGGPGGGTAGESLSGLARSFFYAGARSLMVTHWSVNDQTAAYLVADTLRRLKQGSDGGAAGALRAAELGMIAAAGHDLPAELAHPFYWAPFALVGEGRGRGFTAGL
jgi:CHAT domain-containing protein